MTQTLGTEKKRALITGITGQDGAYLAEYLLSSGYEVWGLVRRTSHDPFVRLDALGKSPDLHLVYGNLTDRASIAHVLAESKPDEIYNLAAQSDVGLSFQIPDETFDINYKGFGTLLEEIEKHAPAARVYQAGSSEMFGTTKSPQNAYSAFAPVSPYGKSKVQAYEEFVKLFREKGLYIVVGYLFNHESPRRGEHFVTRKITLSFAKIAQGLQGEFSLGNLDAKRDWGFAGDYVRAMHLMLQERKPKDYVIATGTLHTVREFVEVAAGNIGMHITWHGAGLSEVGKDRDGIVRVRVDEKYYRPLEANDLCGDASRAREVLGWQPTCSFEELVAMMVESDMALVSRLAPAS